MACMTVNSQAVADFYQQQIEVQANRIRVIPNGVVEADAASESSLQTQTPKADHDTPHTAVPAQIDLRTELGLAPNTKVVGFVGRLAAQKCLRDLIWAFHLLFQSLDDPAVLVIIGDGPERDDLAEFAQSVGCRHHVHFLGHRSDAGLRLAQCDAFCLVSSFEGMSNSLMEAMSAGRPVVVSDIAANRELVDHERTGMVVPLGDSVAIGKALRRVLTDHELAASIGGNAAAKMRSNYRVDRMVEQYHTLYTELLQAAE